MNIFALHEDPVECVQDMVDKHVSKMILESAQLLSTAVHCLSSSADPRLYKPTHVNHPSNIWIRQSYANYCWLLEHFQALNEEFMFRRDGIPHASWSKLNTLLKSVRPSIFPSRKLTVLLPAMKPEYKINSGETWEDVVECYRHYYTASKLDIAEWTVRRPPQWFIDRFEVIKFGKKVNSLGKRVIFVKEAEHLKAIGEYK